MRSEVFFINLLLLVFGLIFSGFYLAKVALANTITLSGNVSDSGGLDIVGAAVSAIDSNTNLTVGSTTTDNFGNYTLNIDPGTYDIQVDPPTGSGFTTAIALSQSLFADKIVNFTLVPIGSVTLSGHVYDPLGNPLPDQKVQLVGVDVQPFTTTDSSGNYSLQVNSDTYTLIVNNPTTDPGLNLPFSYVLFVNNFSLTQSTILDITIPAKQVTIHVQDQSGSPVSVVLLNTQEGSVTVSDLNIGGGITNATGFSEYRSSTQPKTDSLGNVTLWLFPNSPGTSYTLIATPPSGSNFAQTTLSSVIITADTTETITLQQPVTLSGHVYDPFGNPLPNQRVELVGGDSTLRATTDSSGNYSIQSNAGTYTLIISNGASSNVGVNAPSSYVIFTNNFSLTQSTNLDITLPAKKVTVYVQDASGNPISDVNLMTQETGNRVGNLAIGGGIINATGESSYRSINTNTDSSGNVTLWLFPNDSTTPYTLIATPPGGSNFLQTILPNVVFTNDTTLTITLQQQQATLSGHIYDPFGNPLPNQRVELVGSGIQLRATTDSFGSYSLQVTGGSYTLIVSNGDSVNVGVNAPQTYVIFVNNFSLAQSTILDINIPAKRVIIHVQDQAGNSVSDVLLNTQESPVYVSNLSIGGNITDATGFVGYRHSTQPKTDTLGNVTLWLFPNSPSTSYSLIATPPSGSNYATFALNDIVVTSDQTEIIVLQFINQAPTVNAGGPYEVNEGEAVQVTATGNDPENEPLTYAWDLDNNGSFETPGQTAAFSAAGLDGQSSYTIAVQATDDGNLTAADQATVNVLNVAPTATFTNISGTIIEGSSATLTFSDQLDPGSADSSAGFLYSYDCTNDGSYEVTDTSLTSYACAYPSDGTFTVLGRIKDKDNGYTDYMVPITVLNLASIDFYLHGTGPVNNPPTLFLDNIFPTTATEKYRDSVGISFSGGNPWKDIGLWDANPALSSGILNSLSALRVWLGLKNSDDIGTRFDLRAEVYKNGTLVASSETYCITGVTRNPALAKEVIGSFGSLAPLTFDGASDVLSLKLLIRIGTDGAGGFCGGHSNAVGLRLYFDSTDRTSRFNSIFVQ